MSGLFFVFWYDAIEARDCDTAPLAGGARQALELGAGEAAPLWLLLLKCHKNWAKHVDISLCVSLSAHCFELCNWPGLGCQADLCHLAGLANASLLGHLLLHVT